MSIITQLHHITAQLPPQTTLIAVSKHQPSAPIQTLLASGHRHFGENRVQEAARKWPELKALYPDTILHFIGPLQRNKVREAVAMFDVIHTVDRPSLAEELATEKKRVAKLPDCFIQVNIGREAQKSGIAPEEAIGFIDYCRQTLLLPVIGLMCIPPAGVDASPYFAQLQEIASCAKLLQLSMGMSNDYPQALRYGATYIRVGQAIFEEKEPC